ncbi:unnamed protein product [Pleuronectes platessa]|uniref:Uncharacterized protein n=1 Tax=Pleuronectes platessa TaxID=8262 RepID=A0A9N7U5G0_PLEPL|nr:unnamed protein product [Pleuronectes platessa]
MTAPFLCDPFIIATKMGATAEFSSSLAQQNTHPAPFASTATAATSQNRSVEGSIPKRPVKPIKTHQSVDILRAGAERGRAGERDTSYRRSRGEREGGIKRGRRKHRMRADMDSDEEEPKERKRDLNV